ncbi:MAG: methyltransferase domain-containing protein, partial [Bacteroidetes bacterium]
IIGVEPSEAMLSVARAETNERHISYLQAFSDKISLASASADIITCSQSFHWMEPKSTLKEIDRILKPDGVLLIYDVIWPPSVSYEYEQAYRELFSKVNEITKALPEPIAHRWSKAGHLQNVEQSNYFDYVKESYFHKSETFYKETFLGIALSQGGLEALLKRGFSEEEIGVTRFKGKIESLSREEDDILTYNYRVILGVRRT